MNAPGTLAEHAELFVSANRATGRFSDNTAAAYTADLRTFIAWCAARKIERPAQVTRRRLAEFQRHLTERGLAASSIQRMTASLKAYFAELVVIGRMKVNPVRLLDPIRKPQRLPKVLSVAELDRLLAAPDDREKRGLRDRALLALLADTGLRASEVVRLALVDVDLTPRVVFVRQGKGGKGRIVVFTKETAQLIRRYVREVRPYFARNAERMPQELFLTQRAGPFTRAALHKLVVRYGLRAGIPRRRLGVHVIRHSFATALLSAGADLRVIQQMLGHADIGTTQIYTHLDRDRLRKVWNEFHPAAARVKRSRRRATSTVGGA